MICLRIIEEKEELFMGSFAEHMAQPWMAFARKMMLLYPNNFHTSDDLSPLCTILLPARAGG